MTINVHFASMLIFIGQASLEKKNLNKTLLLCHLQK